MSLRVCGVPAWCYTCLCVAGTVAVMSVDLGSEWMKVAIVKPGVPMEIVLNKWVFLWTWYRTSKHFAFPHNVFYFQIHRVHAKSVIGQFLAPWSSVDSDFILMRYLWDGLGAFISALRPECSSRSILPADPPPLALQLLIGNISTSLQFQTAVKTDSRLNSPPRC